MKSLEEPDGAGLHRPVMPLPDGISRSHTATCGRSFTVLAAMLTLADVRPGDAASIRMFPAFFDDCTNAMQYPEKALRDVPLSEVWSVGSPLPTPTSFPAPETRNTTSLSVIGTVRPCPSCTSTANMATSSPSALISLRSAVRMRFEAGPVVSRVVLSTCLPSLKPLASSEPGAYFTTQAACESFFISFAPRLWPL